MSRPKYLWLKVWKRIRYNSTYQIPVIVITIVGTFIITLGTTDNLDSLSENLIIDSQIVRGAYTASATLLVGLLIFIVTRENKERIYAQRGFYMEQSLMAPCIIVHSLGFVFLILTASWTDWWLPVVLLFTVTLGGVLIFFGTANILGIARSPEGFRTVTKRFSIFRIERALIYKTQQQAMQSDIYSALKSSTMEQHPLLSVGQYTSIKCGKSGYIYPTKRGIRRFDKKIRRIQCRSSKTKKASLKPIYYPLFWRGWEWGRKVGVRTELIRIPDYMRKKQRAVTRKLRRSIRIKKNPPNSTYKDTVENLIEQLRNAKSLENFRLYREVLRELLYNYRKWYTPQADDQDVPASRHIDWYHNITSNLILSERADDPAWVQEMIALYEEPAIYFYDRIEEGSHSIDHALFKEGLVALAHIYYPVPSENDKSPIDHETRLQTAIRESYHGFALMLSYGHSDSHNREQYTSLLYLISQNMIEHIYYWHHRLRFEVYRKCVREFSGIGSRSLIDTVFEKHSPHFAFERTNTPLPLTALDCERRLILLLEHAAYILHKNPNIHTEGENVNDYFACIVNGAFPTSIVQFLYLYQEARKRAPHLPIYTRFYESVNPNSVIHLESRGKSHEIDVYGPLDTFCIWYVLHKCKNLSYVWNQFNHQRASPQSISFTLAFRTGLKEGLLRTIEADRQWKNTEQNYDIKEPFIEFIKELAKTAEDEIHNAVIRATLDNSKIEACRAEFLKVYHTTILWPEEINQAIEINPVSNNNAAHKKYAHLLTAKDHKRQYIKDIDDGMGCQPPEFIRANLARQCVEKKAECMIVAWRRILQKYALKTFFETLDAIVYNNGENNYIVVGVNIRERALAYVWEHNDQFSQSEWEFALTRGAHNENAQCIFPSVGTIQKKGANNKQSHESTIPIHLFEPAHRRSAGDTSTLFIIERGNIGTLQLYSRVPATAKKGECLQVTDNYTIGWRISDLARDKTLRTRLLTDSAHNNSDEKTTDESLKEQVYIEIEEYFDFSYNHHEDPHCGYAEFSNQ